MIQCGDIQLGMVVRSRDGVQVGRVIEVKDEGLVVERGAFFVHDYLIPLREVRAVSGEEVHLTRTREHLARVHREGIAATMDKEDRVASVDATDALSPGPVDLEEARMDSARFQEHGPYDARPGGEGAHEHLGVERRASGPGWDALSEEEKVAPRASAPPHPDSKTRH